MRVKSPVGIAASGERREITPSAATPCYTARKYFDTNPEAKDGVMKAYYAYHAPHFRLEPKGHNFTSSSRESKCSWCGRSRELVRHDELPPECQMRPEMPEVADVILGEESRAFALLEKAERDAKKVVAKLGMSGETLAVLHHTYGHEPETILTAIELAPLLPAYEAEMEKEQARSRASQKKTLITVQGLLLHRSLHP